MPGILFEGGTFRPVFSCGVMDALLDNDIMFPYCIGVSAGAADAASYISRQRGRNIRILEKYRNDKRYLSRRNFIKDKSMFGVQFVFRDIPNTIDPFDMDTFQKYNGDFLITTTDANTGETKYFHKEDVDWQFDTLCATCALPVIFPPIRIEGREYYDGGLSNPIPINKVMQDGIDKALVVLTRPKGYVKECTKKDRLAARALRRKYPVMAERLCDRYKIYNDSVRECEKLERDGKVIIIRPEEPLDSMESNVVILRQSYEKGYAMAEEKMDEIRGLFAG